MHIYILDNRYHQSSTANQLAQATVSQGRYDMRRGDNDDKIGIFIQGTISVSSVAQSCFFVIFIKKIKGTKNEKKKGNASIRSTPPRTNTRKATATTFKKYRLCM
jgi:hypothetical protein